MKPSIAYLTPTYKRPKEIIHRCIASVHSQIYEGKIHQYICSDGPHEDHVIELLNEIDYEGVTYIPGLEKHTNTSGNVPRQKLLEFIENDSNVDYITFLDDDNIIFPDYTKNQVEALQAFKANVSICNIIHCGPVVSKLGKPPVILNGNPPVVTNIDTLQVMVDKYAMTKCGWSSFPSEDRARNYIADGITFERLVARNRIVYVNKILGLHF